jgi:hypothetical protein
MGDQGDGWKAAAIDDIPPVNPDWPVTWKSMRHHFGITAFGVNAVTKDAGNVLIPEHEHGETGEQELYIIQRGAAVRRWMAHTWTCPQAARSPSKGLSAASSKQLSRRRR